MKILNNEDIKTPADKARQRLIEKNISYSDILISDFFRLVSFVCEEIENFTELLNKNPELYGIKTMLLSQRLKNNKPCFNANEDGTLQSAYIKVSSHYFEGREAISFHSDGWIGIAGWASSTNEIPFVTAFNRWIDTLKIRGNNGR